MIITRDFLTAVALMLIPPTLIAVALKMAPLRPPTMVEELQKEGGANVSPEGLFRFFLARQHLADLISSQCGSDPYDWKWRNLTKDDICTAATEAKQNVR